MSDNTGESTPVWEKVDDSPYSVTSPLSNAQVVTPEDSAPEKHARFKVEYVDNPNGEENTGSPFGSPTREGLDTVGFDTIGYPTHEAIPMTMFYRNEASLSAAQQRPTLEELHKGFDELDEQELEDVSAGNDITPSEEEVKLVLPQPHLKFGWIKGVLVPCLLNIWGVILYLRLPWLTGQAGIGLMSCIVVLSAVVTTITTLSMSAICTNGEVKGGGAYYLISRSLGPEFGGSIGIIFSLANAVGVALYVVGFSETVQDIMGRNGITIVDKVNDIRIIGLCTVVLLLIITLVGLEWVVRTQLFLLFLLVLSMIDYVCGTFFGSLSTSKAVLKSQGFTGYTKSTFVANFGPEFRGENFFTVFSIFFPAATGILAGVNISGDLKEPSRAVPKGTILAVAITTCTYVGMVWLIGSCTLKDASGILPGALVTALELANGTAKLNATQTPSVFNRQTLNGTTAPGVLNATCVLGKCRFGLLNDYQVMERTSLWGPVVLAGIFAATLSSALASLVGSPKTFQAVCRDGIFTGLGFFGKGSGPNDEPRRAYLLSFVIGSAFIAIGELNVIAPIISNFFLMSYALINYSVFAASLSRSPGWRPAFKYYNMWLSLFGCLICVAIMFLVYWWAALVTVVLVMALYKYVDFRKPQVNWGSSGQAHTYTKALRLALTLNRIEDHVKNFRPQCLVLSGPPSTREDLVHLVSQMTKNVGLMVCGNINRTVKSVPDTPAAVHDKWLRKNKIRAFYSSVNAPTFRLGVQALIQCSGLGKLRPNLIVLGYKDDWQNETVEAVEQYVDVMHDTFDYNCGVAILRLPSGAHFSIVEEESDSDDSFLESEEGSTRNAGESPAGIKTIREDGTESDDQSRAVSTPLTPMIENPLKKKTRRARRYFPGKNHAKYSPQPPMSENKTQPMPDTRSLNAPKTGTIDVWWLFDDGGLTLLLPYLLTRSKEWRGCSLRVVIPASDSKLKSNQVRMASLLKKFRINFSDIVEVRGLTHRPSPSSVERFQNLRSEFADKEILDKKTLRQIRLGELLKEISGEAQLIVMTLPIPRKTVISPILYMGWLEALSNNLPPILLVRGNQSSVLTFYS